jgi:hypothetical protein
LHLKRVATTVASGLLLLATGCGAAAGSHVAQLGSSATTRAPNGTAPTTTDKYAASLAYSRCMRSHGVPNFPDPRQVGGRIEISGSPTGMNPQSRRFASARENCRHLLPSGGETTQTERERALARMLRVSQCMRAHGVSGFPDPTLSPPSDRAGYSEIISNGVAWLAIPNSIDLRSPAAARAAGACHLSVA